MRGRPRFKLIGDVRAEGERLARELKAAHRQHQAAKRAVAQFAATHGVHMQTVEKLTDPESRRRRYFREKCRAAGVAL